ncbi:hypothetical protein DICPUDRAFT_75611 [Dictyostelium purpureum]|uniref:Reverse transcriptase zinc-binding domain-containing protein n=1 Tax=Dictyostelium purpureum TaxID=5786 RepID=F0ZB58_DICPU|nr:uncharacterized protein DICPUDRAFT_75611 [Dictyostelium purpureum]EGC38835.1 hypothetical protein DICPUDRAFT_75611 [Dictyostelium purpureum]|eukprot:XP_003284629.1 hypothetical protein DICPUDRAFT_75611 [Dictyostelium purpureum]
MPDDFPVGSRVCSSCGMFFKKHGHFNTEQVPLVNGDNPYFDGVDLFQGIQKVSKDTPYKYMGVYFNPIIDIDKNREVINREAISRANRLFKSELSGFNLVSAFDSLIVGYLRYYWFLDFSLKDIKALSTAIKEIMRSNGIKHPFMSNDFLHLPRKYGGRGFTNIKQEFMVYKITTLLKFHENIKFSVFIGDDFDLYKNSSIMVPPPSRRYDTACHYASELGFELSFAANGLWTVTIPKVDDDNVTTYTVYSNNENAEQSDKMSSIIKHFTNLQLYKRVKEEEVGVAKKRLWRRFHEHWIHWIKGWTHIPAHIEATFWEAVLSLLPNRMSLVHRDASSNADRRCRLCASADESIEHLVGGCTGMNKFGRITRHDMVVTEIIKSLIKRYKIPNITNFKAPIFSNSLKENNQTIINVEILRDVCFKNTDSIQNKPDIVIIDKVKHIIRVIDVCIPFDGNMLFRQHEKLLKYDYFKKHFKNQYKDPDGRSFDVQIIPIVIGAFGRIITKEVPHTEKDITLTIKSLKDCLSLLPLPETEKVHLFKKLPRKAIIGTILSLQSWTQKFKAS